MPQLCWISRARAFGAHLRGRLFCAGRSRLPDDLLACARGRLWSRRKNHHRTVDTLGKMLRAGHHRPGDARSAKDFQAAFIIAQLDPLGALPIVRVPGTGREPELNERQLHARRQVHQAMAALGGVSSPAGSCVWHVVGLQRSVREWALRQGWGGRPVRQSRHKEFSVAALGMLAAHFEYGEARRAS